LNDSLRFLAIALIVAGLTLMPWCTRNRLVLGKWVPVSTNLTFDLWQAQCLDADGVLDDRTIVASPWDTASGQFERYEEVGEIRFVEEKWQAVVDSIQLHPIQWLEKISERVLAATVRYYPLSQNDERFANFMLLKRVEFPVAIIGLFVILAIKRTPIERRVVVPALIYFLYLVPCCLISYNEHQIVALVGIKMLIVLYGIDTLLEVVPRRSQNDGELANRVVETTLLDAQKT
jgi:hypothetical protein